MNVDAASAPHCQVMRAALEEIAASLPAFSAEAEDVWSNRRWALAYRDLQRIARKALDEVRGAE